MLHKFKCLWCGQLVLNLQREIREHCANCTHRPFPTIYDEKDMCNCPHCPYQCTKAMPFQSCFDTQIVKDNVKFTHPTYSTEPDEIAKLEAMTPREIFQYARDHQTTAHVIKHCPKAFKIWDEYRIGNLPLALYNNAYIPTWFDPEEIAAKMNRHIFPKPLSCPYQVNQYWKPLLCLFLYSI